MPHKVKLFTWKLAHERIPVWLNFKNRVPQINSHCPRCGSHLELVIHCLLDCHVSAAAWNLIFPQLLDSNQNYDHFAEWWINFVEIVKTNPRSKEILNKVLFFWQVWKARNNKIFEGKEIGP